MKTVHNIFCLRIAVGLLLSRVRASFVVVPRRSDIAEAASIIRVGRNIHLRVNSDGNDSLPSGWINPDTLRELKESVDLVSVVESYQLPQFRRTSHDKATAICPFHDDHSPSLSVDGSRRLFKCFACGAGGDAFRFVREYSKLEGTELNFIQAVQYVADTFGDGSVVIERPKSRQPPEKRRAQELKRKRILEANAAAAVFYTQSLIVLPAAGAARSYLQQRGVTPTTVRTFALGYAPESYYRGRTGDWGEGSLVYHLRDLGFKPSEILDAGLAIRTKRARDQDILVATNSTSESPPGEDISDDKDYSTLMDRFRRRLVAPIMDARGEAVLGFGGRELPYINEADKPKVNVAKYLNSPESLVFQKKSILFGQHLAAEAVQEDLSKAAEERSRLKGTHGSVLVVEGYMDAIALWEAGVKETVATMGTAITVEQLTNAAKVAGTRGGQIILCLDNDDAGRNAMERLCSSGILSSVADKNIVEIKIATLPDGVKDPADFLESRGLKSEGGSTFRREVLDPAVEWSRWYLNRILDRYDPTAIQGGENSFGGIFDNVAEFLSSFSNPGDRTKRAYEVAVSLSDMMASETNASESSQAVRIQLESDLIDLAARKANAKLAIQRRIELIEGEPAVSINKQLSSLSRGEGLQGLSEEEKLSKKAKMQKMRDQEGGDAASPDQSPVVQNKRTFDQPIPQRRPRSYKKEEPSLTPHFSGLRFGDPRDQEWLEAGKNKLTLGFKGTPRRWNPVYFFSNDYHGRSFATQAAIDAGYSSAPAKRDPSILEKGVASMVQQDPNLIKLAAENSLLRTLVLHSTSRVAMNSVRGASEVTGAQEKIEWSRPERAWLFSVLVDEMKSLPEDLNETGCRIALRNYLANRADAPPGAFGADVSADALSPTGESESYTNVESEQSSTGSPMQPDREGDVNSGLMSGEKASGKVASGSLDLFFLKEPEPFEIHPDEPGHRQARAALAAQESYARLLWASAQKRTSVLGEQWGAAHDQLARAAQEQENQQSMDESDFSNQKSLEALCSALEAEFLESQKESQDLAAASHRIQTRLLDYSSSEGIEGHVSKAQQERLAALLDAHLTELEDQIEPMQEENGIDESFEETIEQMEKDWGDWLDQDYAEMVSERQASRVPNSAMDYFEHEEEIEEGKETFDEFEERINRDWSWVEDESFKKET